jgi:AraC family transcriptional regulator
MEEHMSSAHGRLIGEVRRGNVVVRDLAYDRDSVLREHRHEHAYVSVLVEGAYTELRDGTPRRCTAGTAIFHRPGEQHADAFVAHGRCINFELAAGEPDPESVLGAVATTHPAYRDAVRAALRAHETQPGPARLRPAWFERVLHEFDWIEPAPLTGAAALAAMHPTHFVRAFRKQLGITPSAYRSRERVRAASRLLLDSPAPLSRIANDCGFWDQSHLTNVFREATGMSPQRYRRAFAR